jgi:hypothetical protein
MAVPESQQVVSESLKNLYMACSAAPPHSPAQQKLVLEMATEASNGKELLLAMRASEGVFPTDQPAGSQVRSLVASKMIRLATLEQLIQFATLYQVNPEDARPFAQRIFQLAGQLAGEDQNPRLWYSIRLAANHLNVRDLEQQAQAKGDQLSWKNKP